VKNSGHTIRHGCKINLFLTIGPRLDNGYHELQSLFVPLPEPCDCLNILLRDDGPGIRVRFFSADPSARGLPDLDPDDNSLRTAYVRYAAATGFEPGLSVDVFKDIPVGGGLGGGSANAAALLLFLQQHAVLNNRTPLERDALAELGKGIGADVPFFLENQTSLVGGIGDALFRVYNPLENQYLVLACPATRVSTAWAYARLDQTREGTTIPHLPEFPENKAQNSEQADYHKEIANSSIERLTSEKHQASYSLPDWLKRDNDFEPIVFDRYPALKSLKEDLQASGAHTARLSGTGASLFGIFAQESKARSAAKMLAVRGVSVYTQRL
jgi:4-diphosphocytidyl-2-C-methyl-D-erythritol kinase